MNYSLFCYNDFSRIHEYQRMHYGNFGILSGFKFIEILDMLFYYR